MKDRDKSDLKYLLKITLEQGKINEEIKQEFRDICEKYNLTYLLDQTQKNDRRNTSFKDIMMSQSNDYEVFHRYKENGRSVLLKSIEFKLDYQKAQEKRIEENRITSIYLSQDRGYLKLTENEIARLREMRVITHK